jgi:hypothetical protein
MLNDFCLSLIQMTSSPRSALSFLVGSLILLTTTTLPAQGQVIQEEWQPSASLDSLQYQVQLSEPNVAFFEFSGSREIDDPLEDFFTYLMDPINWDLTEPVERRKVYRAHTGFQTRQRILSGTSILRFGFETRMEHAHVYSTPSSGVGQSAFEQYGNLVDVLYGPYLILESQPLSWIRMFGNFKLNVRAYDVQHVCPKTCSLEPKGEGTDMVPSIKGGLLLGPWLHTQVFINLGTGSYRFDDREPVGSTAEQQINRTRFLELGFLTNPGGQIELRGSFWGTKNDADFSYNREDEEFVAQGLSHRYGVNLRAKMRLSNQTALTGGLTASRSTFRQTQQPIPLTPQLAGRAALHNDWNPNWSTTLQWQYIGKRTTGNQSFPAFQTLDIFAQYQYPMTEDKGHLTASLGIVNVGNHKSSFSLFHFDSGIATDNTSAIDLNYFPDQPRTFVGGFSLIF